MPVSDSEVHRKGRMGAGRQSLSPDSLRPKDCCQIHPRLGLWGVSYTALDTKLSVEQDLVRWSQLIELTELELDAHTD